MARLSASRGSRESNGGEVLKKPKRPTSRLELIMGRRRSLSAPPMVRRSLIEEHYRVDDTHSLILPGVPKQDDDWPRDAHDFFNLVVLVSMSDIFGLQSVGQSTMTDPILNVNHRSLLSFST